MSSLFTKMIPACCRTSTSLVDDNRDDIWCKDLEKHSCGEFSFAVAQANEIIKDYSRVETCLYGMLVVVYDGHGGKFINRHLIENLTRIARERGTIDEVLKSAFLATESRFQDLARECDLMKPSLAKIGSCFLVGVIWKGTLYIANVGDSRSIIRTSTDSSNNIIAEQLTTGHSASSEAIRLELRRWHPQDLKIVVMKDGSWHVKGIIQVSRSIGDTYLKQPSIALVHLLEPILYPLLTPLPSPSSRVLQPTDKFLIFASDGLWEHITNQEAVEIVHKKPRTGIARRLITVALTRAASKYKMNYKELMKIKKTGKGLCRRDFHDDITVIVVFIDHELLGRKVTIPDLPYQEFIDSAGPLTSEVSRN